MVWFSLRTHVVTSFLTSLAVGFVTGRRENGTRRVGLTVLANLAGAVGLLLGYALARRTKRRAAESET